MEDVVAHNEEAARRYAELHPEAEAPAPAMDIADAEAPASAVPKVADTTGTLSSGAVSGIRHDDEPSPRTLIKRQKAEREAAEAAANEAAEAAAEEAIRQLQESEASKAMALEAARTEALLAAFSEEKQEGTMAVMRHVHSQPAITHGRTQMTSALEAKWEHENRELMNARSAKLLGTGKTKKQLGGSGGYENEMPPLPHPASTNQPPTSNQPRASVPAVASGFLTVAMRYQPDRMMKSLASASQKAMVSGESRAKLKGHGGLDPVLLKGSFSAPGFETRQHLTKSPSLDALATPLQGPMRPRSQDSRPRTQGDGRPRTSLGLLSASPRTYEAIKDGPHSGSIIYKVRYPHQVEPLPHPPRSAGSKVRPTTSDKAPEKAARTTASPPRTSARGGAISPTRSALSEPSYHAFESHWTTRKLPPNSGVLGGKPGAPLAWAPAGASPRFEASRRVVVSNAFEYEQRERLRRTSNASQQEADANSIYAWRPPSTGAYVASRDASTEQWRPNANGLSSSNGIMHAQSNGLSGGLSGRAAPTSPNGRPGSGLPGGARPGSGQRRQDLPSGGGSSRAGASPPASPPRSRPMSGGGAPAPVKGATITSRPGSASRRVDFSAALPDPASPDPIAAAPTPACTPQQAAR